MESYDNNKKKFGFHYFAEYRLRTTALKCIKILMISTKISPNFRRLYKNC